jgi:putative ABC transport system permease protein
MAFSLAPAFLATHANVQSNLKDSAARSGSSGARLRVRRLLAAAEIGLAAVLVVAAGLLVRSLITMTAVDPGFNVAHVLKAEVSLPRYRYTKPQQWSAFGNTLLERIQAQPGLKDSAIGLPVPLADNPARFTFSMPDHAPLPPGTPSAANYVSVSPEYFQVMGIPLLRGRVFGREDSDGTPPVTIVNEAFARFYFGNDDPIGHRLTFGFPPDTNVIHQIVGVVGSVRDGGLGKEPGPMMYVPFAQAPLWGGELLIKSNLPPASVVSMIRTVVSSLDKDLPVTNIATMPEVIEASVAQPKFRAWLLGGFGVVAVLLAAVGVFGVVSYSVASRTQEFGVRAALGASPASIGRMILREGLILAAVGLGAGLMAALGFARFLRGELYGVTAHDPVTFVISVVILLGVAVAACFIPARRAMSVDPIVALRYE